MTQAYKYSTLQFLQTPLNFVKTFLGQHASIQSHRPQKQICIINLAFCNLGRQILRRNNIIHNLFTIPIVSNHQCGGEKKEGDYTDTP